VSVEIEEKGFEEIEVTKEDEQLIKNSAHILTYIRS